MLVRAWEKPEILCGSFWQMNAEAKLAFDGIELDKAVEWIFKFLSGTDIYVKV